jgi:hypothetical protein
MSPKWRVSHGELDEIAYRKRVDGLYRSIVDAASLSADHLWPPRAEWFREFMRRSVDRAADHANAQELTCGEDTFSFLGKFWRAEMVSKGLGRAVGHTLRLTYDPDGQETRRGWASHHAAVAGFFLQDKADVDVILESMIQITDHATWQRYPGWFSYAEHIDHERAQAARFRPRFNDTCEWIPPLLNDPLPEIRYIAAVHIGEAWPDLVDQQVIECLRNAADDHEWVWSWSDHYSFNGTGAGKAQSLLEKLSDMNTPETPR